MKYFLHQDQTAHKTHYIVLPLCLAIFKGMVHATKLRTLLDKEPFSGRWEVADKESIGLRKGCGLWRNLRAGEAVVLGGAWQIVVDFLSEELPRPLRLKVVMDLVNVLQKKGKDRGR